jgi:hypothetical protein
LIFAEHIQIGLNADHVARIIDSDEEGSAGTILVRYGGRISIEEMYRDFKEQGFRLEKPRLEDTERVSRLVLCVCIATVFALLLGDAVETQGKRRVMERAGKRQLSLFQLGLRYLKRLLVQGYDWIVLLALRI